MMIRASATMLFAVGVLMFMFSKFIPFLQIAFVDWIGVFTMCGGLFILLFCFSTSQTGMLYDTIPGNSAVINYIRRDGTIIPLLGKRVFAGESFLDVPRLGLVEDLGKDTVFLWGRKKVRFALENVSFTPDPRYMNVTSELARLGFDDMEDMRQVLSIPGMSSEKDKPRKTYYLTRMADIYWNMTHAPSKGAERLVSNFKVPVNKNVRFRKKTKRPVNVEVKPPEPQKAEAKPANVEVKQYVPTQQTKKETTREDVLQWLNSRQ